MMSHRKYTVKERREFVEDFLAGEDSLEDFSEKRGFHQSSLRNWLKAFKEGALNGRFDKMKSVRQSTRDLVNGQSVVENIQSNGTGNQSKHSVAAEEWLTAWHMLVDADVKLRDICDQGSLVKVGQGVYSFNADAPLASSFDGCLHYIGEIK